MTHEEMRALAPKAKSSARRLVRKQLTFATREYMKATTKERRAWLTGFLDWTRKALEALDGSAR